MDSIVSYHDLKDIISHTFGISHQVLHIHAGLAIYLSCQVALGNRRASGIALSFVLVLETVNELLDFSFHGVFWSADTLQDYVSTLMWPSILYGVSRLRRQMWRAESMRRKRMRKTFALLHAGPAARSMAAG
ncbi:hypothetical protein [Novosphingobium cyanobacteriorum]|uniref:VanZ-like domain-containing protein n=1 Tax=Novosphingobium cyanobacteriorum TaxID=3024215 RepID=A0ABT6CMQ4_9SPHN|nr:hypothetical protein [Novosphingobium cyanobacteriorum]MDF8335195.1 hypothetical protein [Novosphingobium cyanobacteriorum]